MARLYNIHSAHNEIDIAGRPWYTDRIGTIFKLKSKKKVRAAQALQKGSLTRKKKKSKK